MGDTRPSVLVSSTKLMEGTVRKTASDDQAEQKANICFNQSIYLQNGGLIRDVLTSFTHYTGTILVFLGAYHLLLEARMLSEDEVRTDGDYSSGYLAWLYIFIGYLLKFVSHLVSLLLAVWTRRTDMSHPMRNIYREHWFVDIVRFFFYTLFDGFTALWAGALMGLMHVDYSTIKAEAIDSITGFATIAAYSETDTEASMKTVHWQFIYGVRRFAEKAEDGQMMTYNAAIMAMLVIFILRTVYPWTIGMVWGGERPFYQFPFCIHRRNLRQLVPFNKKDSSSEVNCEMFSCGGALDTNVNNQLGAVRGHLHIGTALMMIAFIILSTNNGTPDFSGYVPKADIAVKGLENKPTDYSDAPCAYANFKEYTKTVNGDGQGTYNANPSLYAVQNYQVLDLMGKDWTMYRGLRMNQMRCNDAKAREKAKETTTGIDGNGGYPGLRLETPLEGEEADTNGFFKCCPGPKAVDGQEEDNTTTNAMTVASIFFFIGALLKLISATGVFVAKVGCNVRPMVGGGSNEAEAETCFPI